LISSIFWLMLLIIIIPTILTQKHIFF